MTTMPTLRDIVNDTPADAADVEFNFNTIEDHVGSELINRDGSIPMVNPLAGPEAVDDGQYATLAQVKAEWPTGSIIMFGATSGWDADQWELCNGSDFSTTDPKYADLFSVIGYSFGDPGGGNFNVPDMRSNFPVGRQPTDTDFDTIGQEGGWGKTVTRSHRHGLNDHTHKQTGHTHSMNAHAHGAGSYATNSKLAEHIHGLASGDAVFSRLDSGGSYGEPSTVGSGYGFDVHKSYDSEHDHDVNGTSGTNNDQTGDGTTNGSTDPTKGPNVSNTEYAGNDDDHTNYPPYVVLHFIIKL